LCSRRRQVEARGGQYIQLYVEVIAGLDVDRLGCVGEYRGDLGIAVGNIRTVAEGDQEVVTFWDPG